MRTSGQQDRPRRSLLHLVLAGLLVVAACSGDDDEADGDHPPEPPSDADVAPEVGEPVLPEGNVWVAQARPPRMRVYADGSGDQVLHILPNPTENGAELVFLVDGTDVSGDRIPVYLPVPPNGSKGWVNRGEVELLANPYKITVELGAHQLTVTEAGEVIQETQVGLGRDGRETPVGTYFVKELLEPPDPGGVYGPYAYGISGFNTDPEVLREFEGGVIGIHGTNDPSSIGRSVSSGCIRVPNEVITELASLLPLGTPVEIVA